LRKVFRAIHKNHATNTEIKAKLLSEASVNTNIRNKAMREILSIFPATTDTSENSIFICDCIKAKTEELMRLTRVKAPTIHIAMRVKEVSYHGKNNAIQKARIQIRTHNIVLRLKTFPTIFSALTVFREISRIMIVYSQRSARNAKIHK